jgi:hypothetical protein
VTLIKGDATEPTANSYADSADWLAQYPMGIGYDGKALAVELGQSPADPDKAAQADHRLIMASRWIDSQDFLTGRRRVTSSSDAAAAPSFLALPLIDWEMGAGNPFLRIGIYLTEVPQVIIQATVEVAETMRVNGCLTTVDLRNHAGVLRSLDLDGIADKEWEAPLADQLYAAALPYLRGIIRDPRSVPRAPSWQ